MKHPIRLCCSGPCLALVLLVLAFKAAAAQNQIIYDNASAVSTNVYFSNLEYGDEILIPGGTHVMTEFQFEYYGDFAATGDETARLRIYKNNGKLDVFGDPIPGTVLYDSGNFQVSPGYQAKSFAGLHIPVPDDLTWTIQFSGLTGGSGDEAGLIIEGPPTVGSSYDDFWLNTNSSGWETFRWIFLKANDITDYPSLLAKITNSTPSPISAYLWAHFQPGAKNQILNGATPDVQDAALLAALNGIISGASIYDPKLFAGVAFSAPTRALLSAPYQDPNALNRTLLHDAYPGEITPKLHADFTARITAISTGPTVHISRNRSSLLLQWAGKSVLQHATNAAGPYSDVPSMPQEAHEFSFDLRSGPPRFWRLRQ